MSDSPTFSHTDIKKIKRKINQKFNKALIITLLLSPIICLLAPYFPSKRGRGPMISRMEYTEAVFWFSILWFGIMLFVWIMNESKIEKKMSESRRSFRRKSTTSTITEKSKSTFSAFENLLITETQNDLPPFKVNRELSNKVKIGDNIQIDYEEQTKTILHIEILKK